MHVLLRRDRHSIERQVASCTFQSHITRCGFKRGAFKIKATRLVIDGRRFQRRMREIHLVARFKSHRAIEIQIRLLSIKRTRLSSSRQVVSRERRCIDGHTALARERDIRSRHVISFAMRRRKCRTRERHCTSSALHGDRTHQRQHWFKRCIWMFRVNSRTFWQIMRLSNPIRLFCLHIATGFDHNLASFNRGRFIHSRLAQIHRRTRFDLHQHISVDDLRVLGLHCLSG